MKKSTLYITYDGLTDPLGKAQIIPYLISIAKHPRKLTVLSFEKKKLSSQIDETKKNLKNYNIDWVHLNFSHNLGIISKIIDLIKLLFFSFFLIIKYNIKIVHGRGALPTFFGYLIKKIFNIKLLFDCRGMWVNERADNNQWKLNNWFYVKIFKIFKNIENKLFLNSDAIIVLTNNIHNHLTSLYNIKDKTFIIPCCVDYEQFKNDNSINNLQILKKEFNIDEHQYIFYYSGSLGGIYQLDEMLNLFKYICKTFKNSYFIFFTPNLDILSKKLKNNKYENIKKNIRFKNVDRSLLPKFISLCDIMIYFIKPTFSKKASSPTKLGESLSLGVPVVTNKGIGDIESLFENINPGFLFDKIDQDNFDLFLKKIPLIKKLKGSQLRNKSKIYFDINNALASYKKAYSKLE